MSFLNISSTPPPPPLISFSSIFTKIDLLYKGGKGNLSLFPTAIDPSTEDAIKRSYGLGIDAVVYKIDTAECVVAEDVSNYLDYIF